MAIRLTRGLRPLIALLAIGGTALVAPSLASASPHVKPSVTSVQKQLGELALKNTQLVEKYDQSRITVVKRQKAATAASAAAARTRAQYTAAHLQFVQIIQAQYEGQSFGAAGALLDSNSGTNYLDRLDALTLQSSNTAQVVSNVSRLRTSAATASTRATGLLAAARTQRSTLAAEKAAVEKQITKYRKLLATLTAAQRAAYQRAANPSISRTKVHSMQLTAASTGAAHATVQGAARAAVQFALNQVGKPYVFGAAGPGAFDCSGLTMASWRSAGVSLPHSAAGQYGYGHHVSRSELQPGDLIFFYQPIGHVTIYIGNGMMVSAPTSGQNVSVVPLSAFTSDYTGATRLT